MTPVLILIFSTMLGWGVIVFLLRLPRFTPALNRLFDREPFRTLGDVYVAAQMIIVAIALVVLLIGWIFSGLFS